MWTLNGSFKVPKTHTWCGWAAVVPVLGGWGRRLSVLHITRLASTAKQEWTSKYQGKNTLKESKRERERGREERKDRQESPLVMWVLNAVRGDLLSVSSSGTQSAPCVCLIPLPYLQAALYNAPSFWLDLESKVRFQSPADLKSWFRLLLKHVGLHTTRIIFLIFKNFNV